MRGISFSLRRLGAIVLLGAVGGTMAVAASALVESAPSAFADTAPFELYCPGTPVGTIVLNGAVVTGKISPAAPASGTQFNLTGFQTTVTLPAAIAQATQALGNTAVQGSAGATVQATGATPASIATGDIAFNATIPNPIPASGLALAIPATPQNVGPFTATGGAVTLSLGSTASLKVSVTPGSPPLALSCKAYANNAIPTSGITSSTPPGSPITPQIATATAGAASNTPATTAPPTSPGGSGATTATTAATSTPSATAFTGPGQQLWLLALIGALLVGFGLVSYLVGPSGRGPLRGRLILATASRAGLTRTGAPLRRLGARSLLLLRRSSGGPGDLWIDPEHVAAPPGDAPDRVPGLWVDQ